MDFQLVWLLLAARASILYARVRTAHSTKKKNNSKHSFTMHLEPVFLIAAQFNAVDVVFCSSRFSFFPHIYDVSATREYLAAIRSADLSALQHFGRLKVLKINHDLSGQISAHFKGETAYFDYIMCTLKQLHL